jgi:hypothetical protein
MQYTQYTKEGLELAVKNALCISDVLRNLNLVVHGGNHSYIKSRLSFFKIDTSHFQNVQATRINGARKRKSPQEYLVKRVSGDSSTHALKLRILRDKVKPHECEHCHNTIWQGKPIPLELHHLNGDRLDNRLENIRLVCPNCHALTSNYRGAKAKRYKNSVERHAQYKDSHCIICNKRVWRHTKTGMCHKCYTVKNRKVPRPDKDILIQDIDTLGYKGTGKKYGVSDTAVRKWLK